jgi:hypothetical protein
MRCVHRLASKGLKESLKKHSEDESPPGLGGYVNLDGDSVGENRLLDPEIEAALFDPIIRMARIKRLPNQLGLNDIATLLFYHRRKEPPPAFMGFDVFGMESGFIEWVNNQIECGRIPIEGHTERKLSSWSNAFNPRNVVFEPILTRKTIKTCLEIMELLPLEEGCLLGSWWPDDGEVIGNKKRCSLNMEEQKEVDKKAVQSIGERFKEKYPGKTVTQAKKLPELKPYYEKYPGKDPVVVDSWLTKIGIPAGHPGRQTNAEKAFTPSLD